MSLLKNSIVKEMRKRLQPGNKIKIGNMTICIDRSDEDARGSTCLVYEGHIEDTRGIIVDNEVIIKEFYPISNLKNKFDIKREGEKLIVSDKTKKDSEYKMRLRQFEAGFEMQKKLSKSDMMEILVKPYLYGAYGDSYYLVSDIHLGKPMEKIVFSSLREKLLATICVTDTIAMLHESGYIMIDFKPENLLWVEATRRNKIVYLMDIDSVLSYENIEQIQYQDIRYSKAYVAPQLRQFIQICRTEPYQFKDKRRIYLTPKINTYSIGVYLFELLFERFPEKEDYKNIEQILEKEYIVSDSTNWRTAHKDIDSEEERFLLHEAKLRKENKENNAKNCEINLQEKEALKKIAKILRKALSQRPLRQYSAAQKLLEDLNEAYEILTSNLYIPRRKMEEANAAFATYNLLEKYPLYLYSSGEERSAVYDQEARSYSTLVEFDNIQILNIAIVGSHSSMRKAMLQNAISIGQMLDSRLKIHLIAEDTEKFWEQFTKENPELKNTVVWSNNGGCSHSDIDSFITDEPFAYIDCIQCQNTREEQKKISQLAKQNCKYFVLLEEEKEKNKELAEILVKNIVKKQGEEHFIGYLEYNFSYDMVAKVKKDYDNIILYPISAYHLSEVYHENMYKEKIFKMALKIHEYYLGEYKISKSREKTLAKKLYQDVYSMESSERAAVHSLYKLASLGIYDKTWSSMREFESMIVENDELVFSKLSWLEHRSWTAYMVVHGAISVRNYEQIKKYAYKNGNDWKNRNGSTLHMGHPCIRASRMERKLSEYTNWKEIEDIVDTLGLDPLDKCSYEVWRVIRDIVQEREKEITNILDEIMEWSEKDEKWSENTSEMERIVEGVQKCISYIKTGEIRYDLDERKRIENCVENLQKNVQNNEGIRKYIEELKRQIEPILDYFWDRDFKLADEKMVKAVLDIAFI